MVQGVLELEIGAGRNPMPLFGDATCVQADVIGGNILETQVLSFIP